VVACARNDLRGLFRILYHRHLQTHDTDIKEAREIGDSRLEVVSSAPSQCHGNKTLAVLSFRLMSRCAPCRRWQNQHQPSSPVEAVLARKTPRCMRVAITPRAVCPSQDWTHGHARFARMSDLTACNNNSQYSNFESRTDYIGVLR